MEKGKIVICANASFEKEIVDWKNKLEQMGFEVIKYPTKIKGDLISGYQKEFPEHYRSITESDAIFILNLEKRGIAGYIGPGVFAEMAFALGIGKVLNKTIRVLYVNEIQENQLPYADELKLWRDLGWIEKFSE